MNGCITKELRANQVYYVKSKNEFISDSIIRDKYSNFDKVIVVNLLSNIVKPLLLPIYKENYKKELKTLGISDLKFLKFIIDNEIDKCQVLFFGLNGLHFEAVSFLKKYIKSIIQESNKTAILIDFDPKYLKTTIDLVI